MTAAGPSERSLPHDLAALRTFAAAVAHGQVRAVGASVTLEAYADHTSVDVRIYLTAPPAGMRTWPVRDVTACTGAVRREADRLGLPFEVSVVVQRAASEMQPDQTHVA